MGQRKLTKRELQKVSRAVWYLRSLARVRGDKPYTTIVLNDLEAMASNGTTDGRPYVEPQPEIGEGYRLATEEEKDRRDRNHWDQQSECWYYSKTGSYDANITYRVPIDRIPTDEDARQRPTVMVRDNDKQSWEKQTLLAVAGNFDKFITSPGADISACFWMQARFPYPGELD